ncbi:MAG: response regulator [Patescibacteria group bacterium]|nr:response regulator [Patescibacteria group bacterium]
MSKGKSLKKKILIVEDEKVLAEMYYDTFVKAGFEVISAIESKEALEITKKEKPDLIILDLLLPRESGLFFLKWLKKDLEIAAIPVIVFTNYDGVEARRKAIDFGVKDYLIKADFTPKQFVEKVKKYLK